MKTHLHDLITHALRSLQATGILPETILPPIGLEHTRDRTHGDFASTIALALAKTVRRPPRELAEQIAAALPPSDWVAKVEVAGPGYLNFFLTATSSYRIVGDIL
ncbi:MAG: hypothetical protein N3D16_12270, partial [Anaerolineales bacterium]|nr:hypothetical protein [Anaerolineales bacterium]